MGRSAQRARADKQNVNKARFTEPHLCCTTIFVFDLLGFLPLKSIELTRQHFVLSISRVTQGKKGRMASLLDRMNISVKQNGKTGPIRSESSNRASPYVRKLL
jgi:hypothetical protein